MIPIHLLGIHPINIVKEHESSQVKSILIQVQEHGLNKYTIYKSENTTYNIKTSQNIVNEHESSQVKSKQIYHLQNLKILHTI